MWQERPSTAHRRRLVDRLLRILPPPSQHARSGKTCLGAQPAPERVAQTMHREPGFAWMDGAAVEQRIFARPLAVLSATGSKVVVQGPGGRAVFLERAFNMLEAALTAWGGPPGGMLVGFLGYELASELEALPPLPPRDFGFPDLWLGLFDACLSWEPGGWRFSGTDAWRGQDGFPYPPARAEDRLLAAQRENPIQDPVGARCGGPVRSLPGRSDFAAGVSRTVARIIDGELFQTNLCRRLEVPLEASAAWPLYLRMRKSNPARYGAFLRLGPSRCVLSMSPELFLKASNGMVESRPIKGTRPRGKNAREDAALAEELRNSGKDRAELAMIVDVVRNDLGRVCATGSVCVESYADLLSLATVHHTSATITGRLRPDRDIVDLLRAAFPPASVTGAPKIQAIQVALEQEKQRRGPAMGAIGWIALGGDLQLSVAIRTAVATGGRVLYCVGSGITAGSDPDQELEETSAKARAFVGALGLPCGLRGL